MSENSFEFTGPSSSRHRPRQACLSIRNLAQVGPNKGSIMEHNFDNCKTLQEVANLIESLTQGDGVALREPVRGWRLRGKISMLPFSGTYYGCTDTRNEADWYYEALKRVTCLAKEKAHTIRTGSESKPKHAMLKLLAWINNQLETQAGEGKGEGVIEPLGKVARLVYEKLSSLKEHEAMTLPEIQNWYEKKTPKSLDEGTWKNIRKELEPWGLHNKPRVGYYIRSAEE